jgi:D-inositol-3-phosphate glycosyltransferase
MRPSARDGAPPSRFFRRARGFVDFPHPGTELPRGPVHVGGWCLFPGATVARVEVRLNDGPRQLARLALERSDIASFTGHPDAPICAFEFKADLMELAEGAAEARIEATAYATDGRTLALDPVVFAVGAAEPPFRDLDGATARLRARSVLPVRRPSAGATRAGGLRLLAFTHMLVHGGASLYLLELIRRLARDPGFSCELVTLSDGPLREQFEEIGVPVHVTDGFPVTSVERYEGHLAELVGWAAPREFDCVLVNTLGSFAAGDLAGRLGIPALWSVHESFTLPMFWHAAYPPGALHPYVRAQAEQALRSAGAVVFPAEATRRLFLPNADPERLLTLPYGLEFDSIDAARRAVSREQARQRLGIDPDARVVLSLGSIEPRKSQVMLAAAFAQIAARHPRVQLALVGETTDAYCAGYREALHAYVERAGLGAQVRIEPVTDDPYSWHAVADVVVCASDVESLPRSITEAMSFGTPVLSTRVFGVPELIEDGVTGYLCAMRDLADLAAGLDRVLGASDAERAVITQAAEQRVRGRHDPAAYAAQIRALLDGLAADSEALPGDLLAGAGGQRSASSSSRSQPIMR